MLLKEKCKVGCLPEQGGEGAGEEECSTEEDCGRSGGGHRKPFEDARSLFEDAREAAGVLAKEFRADDDLKRPHMSLGYLTPAEFAPRALGPESLKALFRA